MFQKIRTEKGFSQAKLASESGVSIHIIRKYEQGSRNISTASAMSVYKLAKTLGVRMEELMEVEKLE